MAKVIGNLCAPTGKYLKDGEEKTQWTRCGIVMETDKGLRIKLDTVPVGGEQQGIWFSVFPIEERNHKSGQGNNAPGHGKALKPDDDIPF